MDGLRSGSLTQGPAIEAFKQTLADYVSVKYAVSVSSCTAGLHLAALVAGGSGKSLVTSPITFAASATPTPTVVQSLRTLIWIPSIRAWDSTYELFRRIMSDSCLTTHDTYPLSVVISTLGGKSLRGTIEQLNRGTVVPDEILVCIPEEDAYKVTTFSIPNVRVIKTDRRGQVAQRIAGFQRAGGKYVMQLDDDVMVDEYCIERLVDVLASSSGNYAVSPALRHIETDRSVYSKWSKNKIVRQMYYFLINGVEGYKPGTVTKAGTEIGVDPDLSDVMRHDVDWLPGGCVVHCRNNLVLSNYYPHSGKAYCEDMYHSRCLREMGVKMLIVSGAVAWIGDSRNEEVSFWNWLKELLRDYSARRHYLSVTANNYIWMHIFYIIRCFGYILKALRRIVKSCRI